MGAIADECHRPPPGPAIEVASLLLILMITLAAAMLMEG